MEKQFAVKVVQHMQTYWSILEKVKGSSLRLTKVDDEIYQHLLEAFPEFDPAKTIDEDEMKSAKGKHKWRTFILKVSTTDVGKFGAGEWSGSLGASPESAGGSGDLRQQRSPFRGQRV